jgi:hypothetical protein
MAAASTRNSLFLLTVIIGTQLAGSQSVASHESEFENGVNRMTVSSINGSGGAYFAQQADARPVGTREDQSKVTSRVIEDKVDLTPEAQQFVDRGKFNVSDLSEGTSFSWQREGYSSFRDQVLAGTGFTSWSDLQAYHEQLGEYGAARGEFANSNAQEMNGIMSTLLSKANGLLNGAAFDPQDLSKPITTTDGRPQPQAEPIRAFIRAHQSEYDQLNAIRQRAFPTFEQWQVSSQG